MGGVAVNRKACWLKFDPMIKVSKPPTIMWNNWTHLDPFWSLRAVGMQTSLCFSYFVFLLCSESVMILLLILVCGLTISKLNPCEWLPWELCFLSTLAFSSFHSQNLKLNWKQNVCSKTPTAEGHYESKKIKNKLEQKHKNIRSRTELEKWGRSFQNKSRQRATCDENQS